MPSLLTYLRLKATALLLRLLIRLTAPRPRPQATSTLQIPSRNANRTIKAYLYSPPRATTTTTITAKTPPPPLPVLINMHGSGFVLPMHGEDTDFCLTISRQAHYTVLDISYRLAPEHPFPCAPQDVEDVVTWVLSQPHRFDTSKIALSGFSAGANLALVTAAAGAGKVFPKGTFNAVLAFYPPCDLSVDPSTKRAPDTSGRQIPDRLSRFFDGAYVGDADPRDANISPKFMEVDGLPATVLVVTAACDSLCLEGEAFAERAKRAEQAGKAERAGKRRVIKYRAEGCNHAWDKGTKEGTKEMAERDRAYELAVQVLQDA